MKGFILGNPADMLTPPVVVGFGDESFCVREIPRKEANEIIINNHYSGKIYSASYIHLGVFVDGDLVGVLQFGYAMNPASCGSVVLGTEKHQYLELNRMWLSDNAPRYSETRSMSYAFKFIRKRFPCIKWVQSFADERCKRFGVVYQAANFDYYGEHTSVFWELDGVVYHNSLMTRRPELSKSAAHLQSHKERASKFRFRQFRYIYWLDRRWKPRCKLKQKPYPKHGSEAPESDLLAVAP